MEAAAVGGKSSAFNNPIRMDDTAEVMNLRTAEEKASLEDVLHAHAESLCQGRPGYLTFISAQISGSAQPTATEKKQQMGVVFYLPEQYSVQVGLAVPSLSIARDRRACKMAAVDATYCEIYSTYGHDAFLLEFQQEMHLIKHFRKRIFDGETAPDHEPQLR